MSIIAFNSPSRMYGWMLSPFKMKTMRSYSAFITSGFIHSDIGHLVFNMFTFYFFAFALTNMMGPVAFAVLYFASMIISNLPSFIQNRNNASYASLGASGAIAAVVFGYIMYDPLSRIFIMFIPIGIPAFVYAFLYLAYCAYAARKQGDMINHSAHFWGSLAGIAITILFDPGVVRSFIEKIIGFVS
ncbi:MAG TPA: rhomboid family intramembrane serine protease [Spirochaetota bacterium]